MKDENQREGITQILLKEREKTKFLPSDVVKIVKMNGFSNFNMTKHTNIWQNNGNSLKIDKYGCLVANKTWYWYQSWVDYVLSYCTKHEKDYK